MSRVMEAETEAAIVRFLARQSHADAAHDLCHVRRVVANARRLAELEGADLEVVEPAAWLHDCVAVSKNSPLRAQASRMAAEAATAFLQSLDWPPESLAAISHAIECHSYSANLAPTSLEAEVVQDADRLDALGAIGIARCMMVGGKLDRRLYHPDDPFCHAREADDLVDTLDHFYTKLLGLPATMNTRAGQAEAKRRVAYMKKYLEQLGQEIQMAPVGATA